MKRSEVQMNYKRWDKVIKNMKKYNMEEIIISSPAYIFYLIGIWLNTGERLAVIHVNTKGEKTLIINELFGDMVQNKGIAIKLFSDSEDAIEILSSYIGKNKTVGIDKNWPAHFLIEIIEKRNDMRFIDSSLAIDEVRMVKDEEEIEKLRKASTIADKVILELINSIPKNLTEKQMADSVIKLFSKYNTYKLSFEAIVAFGANCSDPHHEGNNDHYKNGDSILMDIGGVTEDYCSDISRTVFFGEPEEEAKKIYEIVLKANLTAISKIKPGIKFSEIDRAAREVIEQNGYGEYYIHRTGHCIGIEDHEYPSVSSINDMIVQPGMVFSIEPGIYLPNKYGVRIEDLVVVTQDGVEVLNKSPKDLRIIQ
jgi:Xaa-Pro dipeptidase